MYKLRKLNMKRVQLLLLALVVALTAGAAVNNSTPDFAFPQKVDKDARKDLNAAIKADDAHAALNALMRVYIANQLINEEETAQQSIELAESVAQKFVDSPLEGMFYALMAKMYYETYESDSWTYNERQMPLEPRPADITEWSGEQYTHVIDSLLCRSVANPSGLSSQPIGDYADIVTADKLTQIFYPTLYDFVCSNAADIAEDLNIDSSKYFQAGLDDARRRGSVAAEVLWQTAMADNKPFDERSKKYKDLYLSLKDCEYSALPLSKYVSSWQLTHPDCIADRKWAVEQIDALLARWPSAPLADMLKSKRQSLMQAQVTLTYDDECMSDRPLRVAIENTNTPSYTIHVFRLSNDKSISTKDLLKMNPVQTIKKNCDLEAPFISFDTIDITLDKQGYYAIVANAGGFENIWVSAVRCVDVMPIIITTDNGAHAAVVNPRSGAPISDAGVSYTVKEDNKPQQKYSLAATDAQGLTDLSSLKAKLPSNWYKGILDITYGGMTNCFENQRINFPQNYEDAKTRVTILTDRAIYHPGDSVHYLLIANDKEKLATGAKWSVKLDNANYEEICKTEVATDEWGRANGAFAIPANGLTGRFAIQANSENGSYGRQYFTVSDYRMPDFELVDIKVDRDVPEKGDVTVTGRAVYYSGMPMSGASITADLQECFWYWRPMPGDIVKTLEGVTGGNGEFSIVFTAADFPSASAYSVGITAVSPSGFTATEQSPTFSLGKQYVINLDVPNVVNGEKPFSPTCQLASYSGDEAKFDVKWTIETIDSVAVLNGNSLTDINLSTIAPARYRLVVEPIDTTLADAASSTFILYNVASGIVPETGDIIWLPTTSVTAPSGSQVELLFGVTDSTFIYSGIATPDGCQISGQWYPKGYHTIKVDAAQCKLMLATAKDFDTYYRNITVSIEPEKPMQIIGETFRDKLVPGDTETWRLRVVDGEGRGLESAMALDMYNRSLDALVPHNFSLSFPRYVSPISIYIRSPFNGRYSQETFSQRLANIKYVSLSMPQFSMWSPHYYTLGLSNSNIKIRGTGMAMAAYAEDEDLLLDEVVVAMPQSASYMSAKKEMVYASVDVSDGVEYEVADETVEVYEGDAASAAQPENIQMRDGDVPLAVWAPQLTTDAEGNVCYTFTVPNANASWRLYATAWTQSLRSANLTRDFVANKPLMVQPNAPRFMRAGDKAEVAIALLNNTDSLASVQAVVEVFDPATGIVIDTQTFDCDIDSMAQSTIFAHIEATSMQAAIGFRVKAFTSRFGDGEQLAIPVLPADASLVETTPFYLNPGDSTFTMTLPAQPDARISLTYCENPAWTIVSALPGLREDKAKYANSAAAVIFSAAIAQGIIHDNLEIASAIAAWQANPADSALVSMLEKNEDLKIAMLNATPWVQAAQSDSERMARLALLFDKKQTSQAIGDAIDVLQKLQRADGGWAWGDWCQQSSPWVTGRVLAMMADLKSYGWLPADKRLDGMIKSALKYWDKEVEGPNVTYAIVRKRFADVPVSTRGQQAITKTVNDILKHWKSYSNPVGKAIAAQALYLNGYQAKSRELMSSVTEFGVWSESQGLRFPSVNALSSYAAILKAYAMIEPGSRQVDGLRQQLIVRKQATDWGTSTVTSDVVAAILSSGSRWTVAAQGADITAGGQTIAISGAIETATGSLRADLSAHAGQTLTVTAPSAGPSYGAVYSQFSQAMADVKASACDDLSIEKTMMVRRGAEWAYVDGPLQVGDRVKVQLTIHARRNLDYVEIIDERPAAFEPADQLPGWLWSQGASFYRENRDAYTALHIVSLAPGTYQLTYEMNVNTAGAYSSGVATIQSQYAPELSAHSAGTAIHVLPQ